jgi:hypothetical protein
MLNQYNIDELKKLLVPNNVPVNEHEIIIRQIEYDMWGSKAGESKTHSPNKLINFVVVMLNLEFYQADPMLEPLHIV